jgi:hypothetical protein
MWRRGGRWSWLIAAVVGVVLVLAVTALIGNRDSRDETVSAGEWAQNVCGSVAVWRGQLESIIDDLRDPSAVNSVSGEEPQSETPQGRTGFVRKGLDRAVEAADVLVEGIDNAGVPDTAQGQEAADQVSEWANSASDDLEEAQDSLDEEADTLEAAIEQLAGAAGAIGSVLASGVRTVTEVVQLDPELGSALQASSTCQQLREEAS